MESYFGVRRLTEMLNNRSVSPFAFWMPMVPPAVHWIRAERCEPDTAAVDLNTAVGIEGFAAFGLLSAVDKNDSAMNSHISFTLNGFRICTIGTTKRYNY